MPVDGEVHVRAIEALGTPLFYVFFYEKMVPYVMQLLLVI